MPFGRLWSGVRTGCATKNVKGVNANANLYSLIETAKANVIEPYAYLLHLFTELPKAKTVEEIDVLLPENIDIEQITLR